MLSICLRPLLAVMLALSPVVALGEPLPPDRDEPSGYMVPRDESPLSMLNPFTSDWRVWLGPLLMGALVWLLIRVLWPRPSDDEGRGTDPDDWP
ncbi:MAG: hypothetical protein ACXIUB_06980 [Wenzhouxiangella sp.]